MPRAAPGENARGALRRKLPKNSWVSDLKSDRYLSRYPYRFEMEAYLHHHEGRSEKCNYFTRQLSCFEVERGRLGEVVSLVGDCRPPPPGNPRRPVWPSNTYIWTIEMCESPGKARCGRIYLFAKQRNHGGVFLPISKHCSFNSHLVPANLKKITQSQYFKKYHSYFSCTVNNPVLKFVSLPLPPMRVNGSGTPAYSDNKCSRILG
jgi:hypothetical protein